MDVGKLKEIIRNLSDDAVLLISEKDVIDVETVSIEYHSDGRCHVIFGSAE